MASKSGVSVWSPYSISLEHKKKILKSYFGFVCFLVNDSFHCNKKKPKAYSKKVRTYLPNTTKATKLSKSKETRKTNATIRSKFCHPQVSSQG